MKKKAQPFQHEFQTQVAQKRLNQQASDIATRGCLLVPSLQKSKQRHVQTKIRNRDLKVIRLGRNKLYCPNLGRLLPSTRSGHLDLDQLAHEIASRQLFYPLIQHQ